MGNVILIDKTAGNGYCIANFDIVVCDKLLGGLPGTFLQT